MRWGILCWDRRSIGNNVGGGATALLFPPSKQPFRTVFRLAYSTGRGILDLVTAIVVCLAALGGIPKLPPQPLNAVSSSPRRVSSLGAASIFSLSFFCTGGVSVIFWMEYHLPRRGAGPRRALPLLYYAAASASEGLVLMSR